MKSQCLNRAEQLKIENQKLKEGLINLLIKEEKLKQRLQELKNSI